MWTFLSLYPGKLVFDAFMLGHMSFLRGRPWSFFQGRCSFSRLHESCKLQGCLGSALYPLCDAWIFFHALVDGRELWVGGKVDRVSGEGKELKRFDHVVQTDIAPHQLLKSETFGHGCHFFKIAIYRHTVYYPPRSVVMLLYLTHGYARCNLLRHSQLSFPLAIFTPCA